MWQIISGYISACVMFEIIYLFGKLVLDNKRKNNEIKVLGLIFLFSILQAFIFLRMNGTIKSLVMTLVNIYFISNVFGLSLKKSTLMSIIYMILFLIYDFIEMFFVTNVLGLSMDYCFNTLAGSLISNIIIGILTIVTTLIMKNYFKRIIEIEIDNNKKIIILSVLTLISIFIFFYEMGREFRISQNFWIYLLVIIVLMIVLYNLFKQTIINEKIRKEYDQLLEFMTTYEEEIEKQRTLRHETKNEFLAIRAKICDKEKEEAIVKYIDNILGDSYLIKQEKYAKFGYLPPNGIKGLCYFKTQKAESQGINVSINISKKIKESTIFELDTKMQREFAKILGVFLDNAIEASIESKEKELGIEAYSNIDNEFRMIISNTYNNQINEEKMGKEAFTTKGKGHGHGLLLVNEIVKNNILFETKREIKNGIYSQTIIVKRNEKKV